ncbi:sensor histidine kinase [Clostridium tetanomorphum]|uniref:histidine kinase n=1 Tax=Clostridium tetanomorphum TaxID=1553 RepID=A0A923EEA6_CLOTT|nr:HAMP domain-containing sensor histidine kinase [Clostridium tetanomorphum]MBC2399884.1 HAMP domain-containing histidine kinase [Clostridium tetanomorphum]NRZ96000.1 two-component system sensor histidine kinase VanS [Clostridium tetanomorphum]
MKRKKFKWNYYILSFLIFVVLMLFIDFKLEGVVAEYFERTILFDREKVTPYGNVEFTRGTFYWLRLRDILTHIAVGVFVLLEIVVYFTSRYSQTKARERIINQLEQRISLLAKGEIPEKVQDLKLIDSQINEIIHENELVKQDVLMEMSKKNDLVTYLAHDLKTPLTSIIAYLTILQESEVPQNMRQDYIKKLLEKSYRLEDLTNQFFDITRFSLQEIPLNKSSLDAKFFLEQLTEELYPLLKKKNLKFDINLPHNIKIYADGLLFARVLNNLLKNAIAYSHKDSIIKINGKVEEHVIKLFVENDGDVISQQELKLIFQKFYRRDQSRSQSAGSGLGLAIAREIVQKHQGSLKAESKDGHTVFIITLPNS